MESPGSALSINFCIESKLSLVIFALISLSCAYTAFMSNMEKNRINNVKLNFLI